MAEVIFDRVTKQFGTNLVVDGLDLQIADGEFMVLVGPSGCGKSTALRMLAGLEEISSGTISIAGRAVNNLAPRDRDIAMVFQSYALYPHMTVRENLAFGIRMRGASKEDIAVAVDKTASTLEITHLLDRRPRELSGGQRQRVAVGRAIVRDPKVFLFDEPLSNLDAKLRGQMRAEIIKLQSRLGTTAVYVTHDQVEAMTMGHRLAVLRDGRLQQIGTPMDVYDRPNNVFVASFIGTPTMNLIAAEIAADSTELRAPGFAMPIPQRYRGLVRGGQRVIAGIRPESLGTPTGNGEARIRGVVDLAEPLGHQVLVHVNTGQATLVGAMEGRAIVHAGDQIELAVALESIHLFDAASEARIDAA